MKTSRFYTANGGAASTIFSEKGIDIRESVYFTYNIAGDADTFIITATAAPGSWMTGTIS